MQYRNVLKKKKINREYGRERYLNMSKKEAKSKRISQ